MKMLRSLPARWPWLVLAGLVACSEPEVRERTQVVVAVYADAELEPLLARVDVEIRDEPTGQVATSHAFVLPDQPMKFPLSFGVYQQAGGADWFTVVARGVSANEATLVEYKIIAQFVKDQTGLLSISLATRCVGLLCPPAESCYAEAGSCVPIGRVTPDVQRADGGAPDVLSPDGGPGNGQPVGGDAGAPPSTRSAAVPPSSHGFGSGGGRRGDGTISVYGDGFELGARSCTLDGNYCLRGSLMP